VFHLDIHHNIRINKSFQCIIINKIILEVFGLIHDIFSSTQIEGVLSALKLEKNSCPHCGSGSFIRHGRTGIGRQRYRCRECRRTFSETTGTTFMYSKKKFSTWVAYLFCMSGGLTLRCISKLLGMNLSTAFFWRHKILRVAETKTDNVLSETIEVDEFWIKENFKGNRCINPYFRNVENRYLIILLSCRDSLGNILIKTAARKGLRKLHKNEISDILSPVIRRCKRLVSSRNLAYAYFAKQERLRFCMPASASYRVEGFTLENAVSQTRGFLKFLKGFRSVASKYLSHYVNWYRIMINEGCSLPAQMMEMLSCREGRLRVHEFRKVQFDGTLRQ
jgi:transposase-like protein